MSAPRTSRCTAVDTLAAISSTVRTPSTAASTVWSSGVSCSTWPSERRTSAGATR